MTPPPGLYSGRSTLALVARASAFGLGLIYGNVKLKALKVLLSLSLPRIIFREMRESGTHDLLLLMSKGGFDHSPLEDCVFLIDGNMIESYMI
ncbi:hypothetical protein HID58_069122 [Brassica napus]|uniref:Uncharacterized protein n=1 Tax=Brassica napus TaxID=3708 RepID=A0ABQ7ZNL6_BRANA|nr:hypothetical protein HID58_069122 [Brassica napus]